MSGEPARASASPPRLSVISASGDLLDQSTGPRTLLAIKPVIASNRTNERPARRSGTIHAGAEASGRLPARGGCEAGIARIVAELGKRRHEECRKPRSRHGSGQRSSRPRTRTSRPSPRRSSARSRQTAGTPTSRSPSATGETRRGTSRRRSTKRCCRYAARRS